MKQLYAHAAGAIALTFAIAACVPAPDSTPAPGPTPAASLPAPSPTPTPSPTTASVDNWIDAPQTEGNWTYRLGEGSSSALFGQAQQGARFTITCDRISRRISLARAAGTDSSTVMTIRTETQDRTLPASAQSGTVVANLPATDALLDAMALTRGRFAVEMPGASALYLPAWAEVTRVIEDCR